MDRPRRPPALNNAAHARAPNPAPTVIGGRSAARNNERSIATHHTRRHPHRGTPARLASQAGARRRRRRRRRRQLEHLPAAPARAGSRPAGPQRRANVHRLPRDPPDRAGRMPTLRPRLAAPFSFLIGRPAGRPWTVAATLLSAPARPAAGDPRQGQWSPLIARRRERAPDRQIVLAGGTGGRRGKQRRRRPASISAAGRPAGPAPKAQSPAPPPPPTWGQPS